MCNKKIISSAYNKIFPVLIILSTLFMSIGYAKISDESLSINATVNANQQEGVFIADVTYLHDENADTANSKINYYQGTLLDSQVVLANDATSLITYQVTLYNNSNKEYLFIETLTDKTDSELYSNDNIKFTINGLDEYITTITPNGTVDFTITFIYEDGADVSKNTLSSKLNFRFKELPKLLLSNNEETYTLSDIYPDYTPKEYTFTVSNYDEYGTNNVPMTYSFETTLSSPLTIKIYDETGNEVTEGINMLGDGQQQIQHTYTAKIIWDNSNSAADIDYNSADYADKEFDCNITMKAIPNNNEYIDYTITNEFNINITTASLNFNVDAAQTIKAEKTSSTLAVTVTNYNSDTDYNIFDTNYEITITDNDKFTPSIDGITSTNNIIPKILNGGSVLDDNFDINLAADINNLDLTETATLNITVKSPYVKVITIPLTISLQPVTVSFNANGGTVSTSSTTVYKGKTYTYLPTPTWTGHTFNGWYTATTGGTKITTTTEVTTSSTTQTLYARWTSRLLADQVSVGDYVNYPVNYSNVTTNSSYVPKTTYTGWRVLSVEGSGDSKYVRLISSGIPLAYRHAALYTTSGSSSVTNLTTNFFGISISTSSANYTFNSCGFKNASGATITSNTALQTLFTNDYTQTSSGVPVVKSITKDDAAAVLGTTVENLTPITGSELLAVEAQNSGYSSYYLATAEQGYYLWAVFYEGKIVYTYGLQGLRPVVSLKATVETTGKIDDIWQI